MRKAMLMLVAGLLAGTAAGQAQAQAVCAERSLVLDRLARSHGEQPTAIGLVSNGGLLEVLTSKTGSWTIILTMPGGRTCMMATGESWEEMPRIAMGPAA